LAHALELYFDANADEAVREIWRAMDSPLIDAGARPHVSLAVAEWCDCEPLRQALDLSRIHNLAITFESIGAFHDPEQPVVYLAARKSPPLAALQHEVWHHFVIRARNPRPMYSPPHWLPHCTLTYGIENVDALIARCSSVRLPIEARVVEIGLVDVTPSKVTTVWTETVKEN